MDNDHLDTWIRFLDPEELRPSLMLASIYIATYEILKDSIIGRIKDFYVTGFNENGEIVGEDYQSKVLSKNKSVLYASLDWLQESDAITDDDIETFNKVKQCRNNIAHEISRMLSEGLPKDFSDRFSDMVSLVSKIERWWIVNFEIPLNPEFADKEIIEDEIIPGPIAGLRMMIDVALGDDEKSKYYINEFRKNFPNHKFSS
ncbi:MAG: hypothetical protein IT313_00870 [Anaerolineales bacterium]|nr:hypothetical protein [Anaerolineales bacterium]